MTSYIVENPDSVEYATKYCVKTTDGVSYQVPKEFFHLHKNLVRRKLSLNKQFDIPIDSETMNHLIVLLEKIVFLSSQAVEGEVRGSSESQPTWMRNLDKRQLKFVNSCLGITSWDGKDTIPFYEETLPEVGEVVWVKIVRTTDTSAIVQLLQYGGREASIPYTEVTQRRVRSMGKLIKVGRNEAAQVQRIDTQKGYMDLSKKQVTPTEAKMCEMKYKRGNEVRSVLCHVAEKCGMQSEEVMQKVAYPLYKRETGKDAYHWLFEVNQFNQNGNMEEVNRILGPLELPEQLVSTILEVLKNDMRRKVVTILAEIELTCYECDGVEVIREVLTSAKTFATKEYPNIPVTFLIVGPPRYGLRIRSDLQEEGIALLNKIIEKMKIEIAQKQGQLQVKMPPQVTRGDHDTDKKEEDEDDEDDD